VSDNDEWPAAFTAQMGAAIKAAREAQSLSAVKLAARTEDLGCPIHRVGITKIEAGERALTVPELMVIAAALGTTPLALIFPSPVIESIEVLPGKNLSTIEAVGWFTGSSDITPEGVAHDHNSAWRVQKIQRINQIDHLLALQRENLLQADAGPTIFSMPEALRERMAAAADLAKDLIDGLNEERRFMLSLLELQEEDRRAAAICVEEDKQAKVRDGG
jgi:transcriptional regulator with XRE-family HTH domain